MSEFSKVPSAIECPEPIVLREGEFMRESRIEGEERGVVPVDVRVVREVAADAEAVKSKVSYEVDAAALDGGDADLGDAVAVIDTSRDPEWRLTARVVRRVRTFGDSVLARVTIGTVQPVDYASVSTLAADVAALRDDVVGIDGNLSTAASVAVVENTVTEAIDDLDELGELEF